jgi:anthranilate synthase component 2
MKILVIDNYDSFTYNLVYLLKEEGLSVSIFRNDKITPELCLQYDGIVLSPGPGIPKNAGNLIDIISHCQEKIPILGICLGHQAIAECLGGQLINMKTVYHGIQSTVYLTNQKSMLFTGIEHEFKAGRYHSWIVDTNSLSDQLIPLAFDESKQLMAFQNKTNSLFGIQFHPESILTPDGKKMVSNFIEICKNFKA